MGCMCMTTLTESEEKTLSKYLPFKLRPEDKKSWAETFQAQEGAGEWAGRMGWEGIVRGIWDGHVHTAVSKIDNQQGPTIQHM